MRSGLQEQHVGQDRNRRQHADNEGHGIAAAPAQNLQHERTRIITFDGVCARAGQELAAEEATH